MALAQYQGGCHCGKVRYEVNLDLSRVLACNCSFCTKLGGLLTFTTPDNFNLVSGADALTEYRFNTRNIQHLFCRECGIESFERGIGPDGKAVVAINVRCLDDVDPDALDVTRFDGKHL